MPRHPEPRVQGESTDRIRAQTICVFESRNAVHQTLIRSSNGIAGRDVKQSGWMGRVWCARRVRSMQEASGKRSGQRSPSTASTPTTNRRRKVVHAPITEEILRALEKSFKANAGVQRLANALRQEWFKQIEYPQPEPITQAGLWDSKRPKVLLVVHHDGYVEAYGRDVDVYAVELQPWEEAEEEVEKIPFAYKS